MNMIYVAISLFAVSAIFGLTILIKWLTNKEASKTVIFSHGIIAALALVLVIVYAVQNPQNFPKVGLLLLVLAAIGGFYMFIRDMQKKMSPTAIALVHALLALSGVVALLFFVI